MKVVDSLKKTWSRYPLLEIKSYKHNPNTELKEFIDKLINDYNNKVGMETVTKKTKEVVSYRGSKRSFIDMWGLCRNYYPGTSIEDFLKACFELVKEEKIYGNWFCHTINRYVFGGTRPAYDSYNLREDKLRLDGSIRMKDLLAELGYDYEEFRHKPPVKKQETEGTKTRRTTFIYYWGR